MSPKSGKTFVRPVGRRDFIKLGLAAGSVLIASCSRSQATATNTPIASPTIEIEPLPIEFAAYIELDMSEQSRLLATLPEGRPALPENGLHDMAGLKLSNGLQEETIAFIVYEIDPKEGYTVVLDSTNEKVNYRQSAVMYMEEIVGQGNHSWVKLFGLTVKKVDQQGKIIERQTMWFKPGPADVDSNKKTVSVNNAESVLSYKTTASDGVTQMLFRPLLPKDYLAGMPDTSMTPLPVNLPGVAADKMVSIEATQPEYVFPREIDQIYYEEIMRMGYEWKIDKDGSVLVNFGDYNAYFNDKIIDGNFVRAFTKSESGYKTNAFIHHADKISSSQEDNKALLERTKTLDNFKQVVLDGVAGKSIQIVLEASGAFIEEQFKTPTGEEVSLIKSVVHGFDKDETDPANVKTMTAILQAKFQDGGFYIPYTIIILNADTAWSLADYMNNVPAGRVFLGYMDLTKLAVSKLDRRYPKALMAIRYLEGVVYPSIDEIISIATSKKFSPNLTTLPLCSTGNV